jgi:hypothetical protein
VKTLIMRRLLFLFLFAAPAFAFPQDLTGIWRGHFRSNSIATRSMSADDRYRLEVQIAQKEKALEGITYSYLTTVFYGKAAASGAVNPRSKKVLIQEGKLLDSHSSGDICIMTYFLQYSKSGDEEFLEGTFSSMNIRDSSNCGRGTVFLRKVPSSDFYEEPFLVKRKKEIEMEQAEKEASLSKTGATARTGAAPKTNATVKAPSSSTHPAKTGATARTTPKTTPLPATKNPSLSRVEMPKTTPRTTIGDSMTGIGKNLPAITPAVLRSRSNPVVKSLIVHTNEVVLNIYDDGAIDHDTISVYLDNRQVIDHAMLTDRPIVLTLHLDETTDYHEIVMVAENEGEIPPNTSLMIVKAGDKEYEVRITSTEQKNAVVTFKYEKPK